MSLDVRDFWNFDDPSASEVQFSNLLKEGNLTHEESLEVMAQIARTHSLRGNCEKCHEILDEKWEEAMTAGSRPKASFELERGRAFRTRRDLEKALRFFEMAANSEADDLKVDALHMLAIDAGPEESRRIHEEAIGFAQASPNPMAQRWQGTLNNNLGWSYFGENKFERALICFQNALTQREICGQSDPIRIAKWCVARCHRALGNLDLAMSIQSSIEGPDASGYVYEELGEIILAQGKSDEAKPYFRKAVEMLVDELGPESDRIVRLKSLSVTSTNG
jgi:tetratricopeptide (TPR) repeat protein